MFDICDYVWDIFCLSEAEDVHNVRLALDLFLINVELGEGRYEGSDLNYESIMKKYVKLNIYEKELQKEKFNAILDIAYRDLCTYWCCNNKEDFNICIHEEYHSQSLDLIQEELYLAELKKKKRKRRKKRKNKVKQNINK